MKKLVFAVCAVMLVAFLITKGRAGQNSAPEIVSVSEAAFSVRNSASEDATSFLVGRFAGEDGYYLSFDGQGEVKRVSTSLQTASGTYMLTQTDNGAAVLRMECGSEDKLYSFRLASPEGGFFLTDADGVTERFTLTK